MSQEIYQGRIQTGAGVAEVRITDTAPTAGTPSVSQRPPEGSVTLRMGDGGEQAEGLPTSLGSYFELQIPDPDRQFQDLFRSVFDDRRFTVELDVPSVGTWHGYVKSTLQTRPASRRTRAGTTQVKCFDGLALLKEGDTAVNARTMTVQEVLVEAFAEANPGLDIVARVDVEARTVDNDVVGLEGLRPIAGNPQSYEPPTPGGPGGESDENGLEGSSLREQLNDLCGRLGAVAYQNVRLGAWVFMDVAAVGAGGSAARYDGTEWSSRSVPEQTVTVGGTAELLDNSEDAYKTLQSVRAACTEVGNWIRDPGFEATESDGDLAFWALTGAKRTSDGIVVQDSADGNVSQTIDFADLDIYDAIDGFRVDVTGDFCEIVWITYGNGDTTEVTPGSILNPLYVSKDPDGGHDEIVEVEVQIDLSDAGTEFVALNLLQKLTGNPIAFSGADNKYRQVSRVCYTADDETGRTTVESDAGGFLTVLSDGSEVPATEWQSKRYPSSPYGRLSRWRAVNLLSLRPPPYERLQADLIGAYAPLGTRLQVTKPGDTEPTVFVPLKSRELSIGPGEAVTTLKDVEVPADVVELI